MPIEAPSSFQPIIQRVKGLGKGEMGFFVTQGELGGGSSTTIILLREGMRKLGFDLVSTHGSCYEFYRGGKLAYYRDMIRDILGWSTGRGI